MEMIPLGDEDGGGIAKRGEKTRVEMFPGTGPVINPLATRMPRKPGKTASGEYTLNFESTDLQEVVPCACSKCCRAYRSAAPNPSGPRRCALPA